MAIDRLYGMSWDTAEKSKNELCLQKSCFTLPVFCIFRLLGRLWLLMLAAHYSLQSQLVPRQAILGVTTVTTLLIHRMVTIPDFRRANFFLKKGQ
jgi:hypothetical protein